MDILCSCNIILGSFNLFINGKNFCSSYQHLNPSPCNFSKFRRTMLLHRCLKRKEVLFTSFVILTLLLGISIISYLHVFVTCENNISVSTSTLFRALKGRKVVSVLAVKSGKWHGKNCRKLLSIGEVVIVPENISDRVPYRKCRNNLRNAMLVNTSFINELGFIGKRYFSLSNYGYLAAMAIGADVIWDSDISINTDDRALLDLIENRQTAFERDHLRCLSFVCNPLPIFQPTLRYTHRSVGMIWPRGLPAELSLNSESFVREHRKKNHAQRSIIYQTLVDITPDLNSLSYDLNGNQMIYFNKSKTVIEFDSDSFVPFSSRGTLWTKPSFGLMMLSSAIPENHADIFRSYVIQKVLSSTRSTVSYVSPISTLHIARGMKNENYEDDHTWSLLFETLQAFNVPGTSTADRLTHILRFLVKEGIVQNKILREHDEWVAAVSSMNTTFSRIKFGKQMRTGMHPKTWNISRLDKKQSNVAVCVSGQVRSLNLSLRDGDHPNYFKKMITQYKPLYSVAESIQRNMYPKLGYPDVFMYASTLEGPREPTVGDLQVCEPLRPRNGGHLDCAVPREERIRLVNENLWNNFTYKYRLHGKLAQGVMQQLRGMLKCNEMIKRHSLATGKEYDWIIRIRPDAYVLFFPDFYEIIGEIGDDNHILYGSKKACCCGNEDIFGIGPAKLMDAYLDRFLSVQQEDWSEYKWSAEGFAVNFLQKYGIQLRESKNIGICPLKPLSRSESSDA